MNDRRPLILFADDDDNTRSTFRDYCQTFGWLADFVSTAADIIRQVNLNAAAGGTQYDVIVCDINQSTSEPTVSNIAAVRALRRAFPNLPVVFVSSHSTYWIKDEIKLIGGELFSKPVNFEQLFERVAYLIKWHRSTMPPADVLIDRRRNAVNYSGHTRRAGDQRVEIPESVNSAVAEIANECRPGPGH